jgi:hypothetical protein
MQINKNPSQSEVRRFAATWSGVTAIMGVLLFWRHHQAAARGLWAASVLICLCGAFSPSLARGFYRGWMALAQGIITVVTRFMLVFIYCCVLTPLALIFKVLGRDELRLKRPSASEESYWTKHDQMLEASSYKHLY